MFDTKRVRRFETEPEEGTGGEAESWPRGCMVGGSSAVNGQFYTRGQPQDFDDWEACGASGWSWKNMAKCSPWARGMNPPKGLWMSCMACCSKNDACRIMTS